MAVVAKPPPEFDGEELVIDAPIGRHAIHRERMAVTENGRRAVSRVRVLATDGRKCVVQVAIETGRTHQIRVHLAHIGCHVLGDPVYGDDNANRICVNVPFHAKRPLLHAWRLGFDHPATGERPASFGYGAGRAARERALGARRGRGGGIGAICHGRERHRRGSVCNVN